MDEFAKDIFEVEDQSPYMTLTTSKKKMEKKFQESYI